ncbi:glycosyltransferase family 9 protein [candidate division KSB1 bacterium]|nr:glycosyltransferase family 9 protein [candidate division KSB1 bacterium]RQW09799.1 MAG: glycosyltransferase family 9 protein [candidate division KSB1 bacterium]
MIGSTKKLKVLVFHIGQIGDSVMILPALQAVKNHFGDAEYTLLTDRFLTSDRISSAHLFAGAGFFDRFLFFPKSTRLNALLQAVSLIWLVPRLWLLQFHVLVYLTPSRRSRRQIDRDRRLFRLVGIRDIYGMDGYVRRSEDEAMPLHEADLILARLKADGIPVPPEGAAEFHLNLGQDEKKFVDDWFQSLGHQHSGKIVVAFAPGAKMQAKRWDVACFSTLGLRLIKKYDIFPIVFGGSQDRELAQMLLQSWRRGYNAAGVLSVRQTAEALSRCAFYIGNDSGPMHLAAAVNTRCVAIFSARDAQGKWHPYGAGHLVFRSRIKCEGCLLEYCEHRSCLRRIKPLVVFRAIESELQDILAPD